MKLDFNPRTQKNTHIQVWLIIFYLPQEYWVPKILHAITTGVGVPISNGAATIKQTYGPFARILVNIDLQQELLEQLLVERQ